MTQAKIKYKGDLTVGMIVYTSATGKSEVIEISSGKTRAVIKSFESSYSSWNIQKRSDGFWGGDGSDGYLYIYEIPKKKVKLSSIVIPEERYKQIHAAISQIENSVIIFETWGFADVFEKGYAVTLLFWGIPGTGKTLTAEAISNELNKELKIVQTADIETSEPGGAERMIRTIFQHAKGKEVIILFDECESLLMDRNEVGPILAAQVNALLTEIEKFDGIVIFTTNRLGKLDPALERRITTKVEFQFPNVEQRLLIWKRMIPKKAPLHKNVNLERLAEFPLTGGNIKNVVLNAARTAAFEKKKKISQQHFIDTIEKELQSIQSFASEYKRSTHQSNLGGMSRAYGKIVKSMKEKIGGTI